MKFLLEFFRKRLGLAVFFVLVFLCFQHADLEFTCRVSMNLYTVNPLHLYEEAAKYSYVGPPGNINYLPTTYFLFALWGLPLKLLGVELNPSLNMGYEIFYYKLLPTAFFFGSAIMIKRILKSFVAEDPVATLIAGLWIVSPYAFYSQFIFGQYDVFTLFFTLCGIYAYLNNRSIAFSALFGIAISFKYFPFLAYFPLLFCVEKCPKAVIKNILVFASPIVLISFPYIITQSPEFYQGVVGFSAAQRFKAINVNNGISSFNLILFLWAFLCGYLYFFENIAEEGKRLHCLKYAELSMFLVFFLIFWHPQWLLIFSPFVAFNFCSRVNFRKYLLYQISLNVVWVGTVSHLFELNADQNLLQSGLLGKLLPQVWHGVRIAKMSSIFRPANPEMWLSAYNAMLLLGCIFTWRNFSSEQETVTLSDFKQYKRLTYIYTLVSVGLFPLCALIAYAITISRSVGPN